jgi:putative copper export protein
VDLTALAASLEASGLGEWMRSSVKALPIIEAIHVMAVAVVFGTILIVDLRLLGYPDTQRPFSRLSGELLPFTWIGFVVAVITGVLMFIPNAGTYVVNTAFGLKMLTLLGAGLNMGLFQFTTLRSIARWDAQQPVPTAGRVAGALSIVLWVGVIVFGRWVGFTKGYDFTIPDDLDLDFDFDFFDSCVRTARDLLRV